MRAPLLPLLLSALVLLVGAPPALAASVSVADGTLIYRAEAGEANRLTLNPAGAELRVAERGASALEIGPGCESTGLARTASCPAESISRLYLETGGDRDVVRVNVDLPARIDAGADDDEIAIGGASSFVTGGSGDDQLFGDAGNDTLAGGDGNDTVQGAGGDDRLYGGDGADELDGEDGADFILGQGGDDLLTGGLGADELEGARGQDSIDGGADADRLSGGADQDLMLAADQAPDQVDCGAGRDTGRADAVDQLDPSCERLKVEGAGEIALRTMLPYPIVRIAGEASGSRTTIRRLQVQAPSGSRVHAYCTGRSCPYRKRSWAIDRAQTLTITSLQRRYAAGSGIEIYVTARDRIGKYTRFVVRRRQAPRRTDLCVAGERLRAVPCGQE
jgi:hypothetical protein